MVSFLCLNAIALWRRDAIPQAGPEPGPLTSPSQRQSNPGREGPGQLGQSARILSASSSEGKLVGAPGATGPAADWSYGPGPLWAHTGPERPQFRP